MPEAIISFGTISAGVLAQVARYKRPFSREGFAVTLRKSLSFAENDCGGTKLWSGHFTDGMFNRENHYA